MKIYITQLEYGTSIIEIEVTKETAKMYTLNKKSKKDVIGNRAWLWVNSRVHKNDPNVFTSLPKAKDYLSKQLAYKITQWQQQINEAQQVIEKLVEIE